MLLCGVTFISFFYSLHCPLSGPDLTYISLLIIPCIIYYVTNKETLNLEQRKGRGFDSQGTHVLTKQKTIFF